MNTTPTKQKVELTDEDFRNPKIRITMMVDEDILDHFRARAEAIPGSKYQSLINLALRESMERDNKTYGEAANAAAILRRLETLEKQLQIMQGQQKNQQKKHRRA